MFDFQKPKIEIAEISEDKKYGRFVVEPLERGYGTTLGNSLRRIMLSSLPGAAVSQVKIDGVLHEFPMFCALSLLLPRPALGRVKNTIDVLFDNAVFLHLLLGLPIIFIQFGFPVV